MACRRRGDGLGRPAARRAAWLAALLALAAVPARGATGGEALAAFRERHGAAWDVTLDVHTSRPRRLVGGAHALGAEARGEADVVAATLRFLEHSATVLALDPGALRPAATAVVAAPDGAPAAVHFDVTHGGVVVEGARVAVAVAHGRIVLVSVVGAEPLDAPTTPRIGSTAAQRSALLAARLEPAGLADHDAAPVLRVMRRDDGARLAWKLVFARALPPRRHVAFIDAVDGSLLSLTDETLEQCAPAPAGGAPRRVLGGVRPHRADDAEVVQPFAGIDVGGDTSDWAGLVPASPATSAPLSGPVAWVECVDCTGPESPLAVLGSDGHVTFGSGGSDGTGNGWATPADRAAYFHVERTRRQAARWLALPWLARPLAIRTNLPDACNAYWNGLALNFFRSSPRCSNTGEIRDVIAHEWGHALDENDGIPPPGVAVDAATGEGVADVVALLRSRDACIGESFHLDPADFPSLACSGVRDLDEHAPGQRRGILTSSTALAACPPSAFYRGVLGREGHCEGELLGQAFHHLVRTLATGRAYGSGVALAVGLGDEAAWQVAEALFYRSRPLLASQAPSTMQSLGMSAHDALLAADDEGDGLASGTPHAWAIHDAFLHHEIAEPSATAPTSSPCAIVAPTVTVTAQGDDVSGLIVQRVAWTDTGAALHHVLRGDGDGDALHPVAPPAGPGAGSFDDAGALAGRAVRYVVVAEAPNGCTGTSTAVTAAPAPALSVAAVRVDDSVLGDGDGRLAAGETADLFVDLRDDGGGPATGASVVLEDIDPALTILAAGPVAYGTIPPGASVAGPAAFRVRAAAMPPPSVALGVAASATEGCLRTTRRLAIARPALQLAGHEIDDSAGDADGAWDPGERVPLGVLLRNDGDLAARSVSGQLSFRAPPPAGVTLVRSAATWADLDPAETVRSGTPGFTLDAALAAPTGSVVRLRLEVDVGPTLHASYDIDLVIGGIAAGRLEWQLDMGTVAGLGTGEIVNQPLVVQASDDDNDGLITACDVPDIVVETWNVGSTDKIVVLSGDDGRVLRQFPVTPCRAGWGVFAALAVADVDGDGAPEIVTDDGGWPCTLRLDGTRLWRSPSRARTPEFTISGGNAAPQAWDLDGDGTAELVYGRAVINGEDGSIAWTDTTRRDCGRSLVGDVDLDGRVDVIAHPGDLSGVGGIVALGLFPGFSGHGGLVDLDADAWAEVVYLANSGQPTAALVAREHDGGLLWEVPQQAGQDFRMPPCFGDFDGDGRAETALPVGPEILMFDDDGSLDWRLPVSDSSGASGCSVFDFDRDGRPEILHRDELNLRIVHGASGVVLWQVPCRSVTHHEVPVIADVDNDGSAEVIVHETAGGNRSTLRVYGNPEWPPARGIWNQEAYAVTHVDGAGRVVAAPAPRWLAGNDFRGQGPACPCADPALTVDVDLACERSTACFMATISGSSGLVELTWDFGDGTPLQHGISPCHEFAAPGRHAVRVSLLDGFTCTAEAVVVVDVPAPLAVVPRGQADCPRADACFTAVVVGGTPPFDLAWSFDGAAPSATGPGACHAFPGTTWTAEVQVRDALGCLASGTVGGVTDAAPASVGAVLFVRDHGDAFAPSAEATLDWTDDAGLPRPPDESYRILRGTLPTGLAVVPGTAGHAARTWRDGTPANASIYSLVHYYVVLAEDGCGSASED